MNDSTNGEKQCSVGFLIFTSNMEKKFLQGTLDVKHLHKKRIDFPQFRM